MVNQRTKRQAKTLGDSGESCHRTYICALHVVSPLHGAGGRAVYFPRRQSNVNVNDREERDLQPTTVTTAIRSLESLS
jgi:hypothetical protein